MDRIALALLVLCNFVWSLNGIAGKSLLASYSGIQVGWLRFASAFAAYFLFAAIRVIFGGKRWRQYFLLPRKWPVARDVLILGCGTFALTPFLQYRGLRTVQAMDYSILIALEPLITVWLAWVVLGEGMKRVHVISMAIALIGFLLFSGLLLNGLSGFKYGMILLLAAQCGDCAYSVFSKKLATAFDPKSFLGTALGVGAFLLTVFVLFTGGLPDLSIMNSDQAAAVFCLGPIGSTATYLIWTTISKRVSVASMSVTLFIQPVVGAVLGYLFLNEGLSLERFLGAVLILVAVATLSLLELRAENSPPA